MTSKFNIDNRELLQRISSGEAVVGIDFGNLIVRELAAFRLAVMDSEPVIIVGDDGGDALSYRRLIQSFAPGTKLYRHAQPAPVSYSDFEEFWSAYIHPLAQDDELKEFSWGIWNACVSNSQPAPVVPGWIPVSERIPEDKPWCYEYLVFETLNNRVAHDYWNVPDAGEFTPFWNHYGEYVTHWMPLPASPQEVKK